MTTALRAGITLATLGAMAWIDGCGGAGIVVPPPPPPPDTSAVIVSDLLPAPTATSPVSERVSAATSGGSVVYVSMLPGTVPRGSSVRIENRAGIGVYQGSLTDGGFNPVPVPANVGDTLIVIATDSAGNSKAASQVVRQIRPVRVVRTEPTGGTDVPLNASILAVFSEPLAPGTVTSQTVQLLQNGQAVAGVPVLAPDGFEVSFQPAAALAPLTQYKLVITTTVTSTLGAPLDEASGVTFTTGSQPGAVASFDIVPSNAVILEGGTLQLIAEAKDAAGNVVTLPGTVSWAADTGAVLSVSQTGLVTARTSSGVDAIRATVARFSAVAYPIRVVPPTNVSIAGTWDWTEAYTYVSGGVSCADTGKSVFAQVGGGFTGSANWVGACTSPSGTVDNSGSGPVLGGNVGQSGNGGVMNFATSECSYQASFTGLAPTSLNGTISTCLGSAVTGTWKAARRP
jgi:Big-like domain-containing protein